MLEKLKPTIRLHDGDNVVVALRSLHSGDVFDGVTLSNDVGSGHKIAARAISSGDPVLKYGQVIGYAATDIAAGAHVHVHNLEYRPTSHDYQFCVDARELEPVPEAERATFQGIRRENGKVATRNYIGVLTSVNCSATAARRAMAQVSARPGGPVKRARRGAAVRRFCAGGGDRPY